MDRSTRLRDDGFERPIGQGEPKTRDARIRREKTNRRGSDSKRFPGIDGKGTGFSGTPARLGNPKIGAEPRAKIQEDRTETSFRGEARRDGRALVHDEKVARAKEPRQVLESGVAVAVRAGDEETDIVAGAASNLRGFVGEDAFRSLEDEFGASHAATSHTAACA